MRMVSVTLINSERGMCNVQAVGPPLHLVASRLLCASQLLTYSNIQNLKHNGRIFVLKMTLQLKFGYVFIK